MGAPVPREISLDTLLNIIEGWYSANAHEKTCTNGDVADRVGVSSRYVSRQNDFLVEIGVLSNEGRGKMLTDAGQKYAEALRYGREDAQKYLIPLLYEYEPTDSIVDFVGIRNPNKDTALEQLYKITDYDPEEDDVALRALLNLYIETGILHEIEENTLDSLTEEEYEVAESDHKRTGGKEISEENNNPEGEKKSSSEDFEIESAKEPQLAEIKRDTGSTIYEVSINLELDGTENPKQVRQIVLGIREALEVEVDDIETINSNEDDGEQAGLTSFKL